MTTVTVRLGLCAAVAGAAACAVPGGEAATGVRMQLAAEVRIGSESRGPEYQFTTLRDVVASDSEVFVLQVGIQDIRVFGNDGTYRRTIGRRGAGPGEFMGLAAIGLLGDTLWAIDGDTRRVTYLDRGGAVLGTTSMAAIPDRLGSAGAMFFVMPRALLPGDSVLGSGGWSGESIRSGAVRTIPVLRLTREGRTRDTIAWVPVGHDHLILHNGRGAMYRPQPFANAPITVHAAAPRRVYVVERDDPVDARTAAVRVTALTATGDTAWSTSVPYQPVSLDRRLVDSVVSRLQRGLVPRFSPQMIADSVYAPAYRTPVTDVVAGNDGTLWLRWDAQTRPDRYTVIDRLGRVTAEAMVPARVRLRWVSGVVAWGEELDESDVPTLVRYRVTTVEGR